MEKARLAIDERRRTMTRDDAPDEKNKKNENLIASECWWIDNGNAR